MFGGAEEGVVERGECHKDEIGVEDVEGNNKDCMTKDDDGHFVRAQHLSRVMCGETMRTLACGACTVYTTSSHILSFRTAILDKSSLKIAVGEMHSLVPGQKISSTLGS